MAAIVSGGAPGATRTLRVFHLIKGLGRGGAEMLLVDGPRYSDPAQFNYGFGYFVSWKDALVPELRRQFEDITCFAADSPPAMLAALPRVIRKLRAFKADIVHCHMPLASVIGRAAGAIVGIPVISTEHNVLERYHAATRWATLATWRLQRRVIAVSGEVADSIGRHAGSSVPVVVVKNGVSIDVFDRSRYDAGRAREALGFEPDAPVVGAVAVFRVQKRLDLWLEAARLIARRIPRVRFVLVGDGPLRRDVEAAIDRLKLRDHVVLPGLLEDVRPLLAACDVFLMSSDFEGLPVALLEAMAMEVVPVVTAVGGVPEVVRDGETGRVVRKGSPEHLADAVVEVLSAPRSEQRRVGVAARRVVGERFSTARMMRETEDIYREIVR